jgi:hypothetical protein
MKEQGELFGLIWKQQHPFRLRANDVIRIGDRLGRIIRVSECAAVVLVNQRTREFKTRFDKPVKFQPSPLIFRISANAETEIINRIKKPKRKEAV